MASDGQSIDRLRDYLRMLTPEARSTLIQELERNMLRGDESAGSDLVLQEIRRTIRAEARPVPRIGDAARLFLDPIEPFLIDAPADHKRIGRLARVSIEPIWAWIGRDLIPAETKAFGEDINRALLAGEQRKADQLVRALHERARRRIREMINAANYEDKSRRRLAVQVGTPRALEDLNTIVSILTLRDVLGDLSRRLPNLIRNFDQVDGVRALLDAAAMQFPFEAEGIRKSDLYLYGMIVVMNRLAAPWQLIRLAIRAAESDDTARIAETPYAVAVTLVLAETESLVGELRVELKSGRPIVSILKSIHDAARGLRTEVNLGGDSAWSRQLAAVRADVSGLLKAEIAATPSCVRRLLRPRPAKEIAPGSVLDSIDVSDAENRVEYLGACRHYAGELALNEATMRAHSELTVFLETGTKVLLDTLRHAGESDLLFRQSQVEAAIRFCRIVFGADYANVLAKAAEVAVQTASTERKLARA